MPKNNKAALSELQNKVKQLPRGTYENKATGYKANINSNTIKKALTPTHKKFNWFSEEYINNLNGILRLSELFKTAIYVDTISPMKNKKIIKHERLSPFCRTAWNERRGVQSVNYSKGKKKILIHYTFLE